MENLRTMITFVPNGIAREESDEIIMQRIIKTAELIVDNYDVKTNLFVYEKDDWNRSIFITYKADLSDSLKESKIPHTKIINRNAKTNTFFSINALNRICLKEIGKEDPTHKVKWDNYRDMIFLIKENKNGERELIENYIQKYCVLSIDNGKIEVID